MRQGSSQEPSPDRVKAAWLFGAVSVALGGVFISACVVGSEPEDSGSLDPDNPPPGVFVPAYSGMRILRDQDYVNSVTQLFGNDIRVALPSQGFFASGLSYLSASEVSIEIRDMEVLERVARATAEQVFANANKRDSMWGCAPSGSADDPCVQTFLTKWGKKIWRRTLTTDEVSRYAQLATDAGQLMSSPWKGAEFMMAAMMQSPHFLFRAELGVPDPNNATRLRYTGYEMASRLSFFLTASTPDDTLLDAAENGSLLTAEGIRSEAARLVATPQGKEASSQIFNAWFEVRRVSELAEKDPKLYPQMTPSLRAAMRQAMEKQLREMFVDNDVNYLDLFSTPEVYVNDELAPIYGLPPPGTNNLVKATLDASSDRAGLLGWAGFLTGFARPDKTSTVLRGLYVRSELLCQSISEVPANTPLIPPGDEQPKTTRQEGEQRIRADQCKGCHLPMDPIGFGLEGFDAIGRKRQQDNGFPVNTNSDLDGVPFANAIELSKAIQNHPQTLGCGVRKILQAATGHREVAGELPAIDALLASFTANGNRMGALFVDVVGSEAFRYATKPKGVQ